MLHTCVVLLLIERRSILDSRALSTTFLPDSESGSLSNSRFDTPLVHGQIQGGNSIDFFWPEKRPQYLPENQPEVPFEKDTCINFLFWTFQAAFWAAFLSYWIKNGPTVVKNAPHTVWLGPFFGPIFGPLSGPFFGPKKSLLNCHPGLPRDRRGYWPLY